MFTAERHRFTALGGVIIGTASVAAMSMWFAVVNGLHESVVVALVAAGFWFFFIVNLDRWMTATVASKDGYAVVKYVARLALALIFAFVIAEPFVLRLFSSAIENQYATTRVSVASAYVRCNPTDDPGRPLDADCVPYRLAGLDSSLMKTAELARMKAQIEGDTQAIKADQATLDRLVATAQAECSGAEQEGTSGQRGEGPLCLHDRATAAEQQQSFQLDARRDALARLNADYAQLGATSGTGATTYTEQVNTAIDQRMRDYPEHPGLLEQFAALDQLYQGPNGLTIRAASTLITLLFVAIECLPIIMKLSSGAGDYESTVREQMASASRVASARLAEAEARDLLQPTINRRRYEDQLTSQTAEFDRAEKRRGEEHSRDLNEEIARYRDRLLGGQGGLLPEGA